MWGLSKIHLTSWYDRTSCASPLRALAHFWCLYIMLSKSYLPRRCDFKKTMYPKQPGAHFPLTYMEKGWLCLPDCEGITMRRIGANFDNGVKGGSWVEFTGAFPGSWWWSKKSKVTTVTNKVMALKKCATGVLTTFKWSSFTLLLSV